LAELASVASAVNMILEATSIDAVARRLCLTLDEATVLADDCAQAGYVEHDMSSAATDHRRATALPHSATLRPAGHALAGGTSARRR
jgi:hypothetical protein